MNPTNATPRTIHMARPPHNLCGAWDSWPWGRWNWGSPVGEKRNRLSATFQQQVTSVLEVIPIPALAARPRLCAGTIISGNARCDPPLRTLDLNLAIGPLGGTWLGGWRRDRWL